jgi:hypothetical protein
MVDAEDIVHVKQRELNTCLYALPAALQMGKVHRMAAAFDPNLLGTFTARRAPDGSLHLRDGLHRITTMRQLGLNPVVRVRIEACPNA